MNFMKILLGVFTLLLALNLTAQEADFSIKNHDLPSISQAANIDGVMDEPHWQQALKIELIYETTPDENTPAQQKTTAYLYENGASLFVAFRAEDTNPSAINAYLRDRDSAYDDDFVGIQMDTFNDEQRAYEFFVNPYGVQMDLLFDESSGNEDDSWDAIWDSAGQIDANGYTVEMQIPFSSLRFESSDSLKNWGIELLRAHPREKRRIYRNSPRDRNRNCTLCQFHKFSGFENAKQGNQLEINPVLTIGKSESRNDAGEMVSNGTDYEPGLNVKWGVTPEITLDATLNPDFSQVEADSPQLSVNETFALFFQEKRPFFQEGSDYFNTDLQAIYTRNVTAPEYGLKLTGRQGDHTLGTFVAKDEITNLIIPGTFGSNFTSLDEKSNAFAGRYRYDFNPDLNIGLVSTYRDAGDYNNKVIGIDGFYRWNDKHRLRIQYLGTDTRNSQTLQDDFNLAATQSGSGLSARYNYNTRNWFAYTNYIDFDKDFRADLGFISQVNFDRIVLGGGHIFYSEDKWWNRIEVGGDWDISHDNDGRVLEREIEGRVEVNGSLQSYMNLGYVKRERLFDDIVFDESFVNSFMTFKPKTHIELEFGWDAGERIDFSNSQIADSIRLNPGIHWSVNKHLQFISHHTYRTLDTQGERDLTANLTDFRILYQFNNRSFLRLTAQYQDIENVLRDPLNAGVTEQDRSLNKQLLYSYKVNPRTVFFVGYSDLFDDGNPQNDLEVQQRGLFMKLGYVFDY